MAKNNLKRYGTVPDKYEMLARRKAELDDIRTEHILGERTVDPDDPRTTIGLTDSEVSYVRGETGWCTACGVDCTCDEQYMELKDRSN